MKFVAAVTALTSLSLATAATNKQDPKRKLGGGKGKMSKKEQCGASTKLKAKISMYPEYAGPFETEGYVELEFMPYSTGFEATFDLEGVDPACSTVCTTASSANCCGVHVHAGTTCWLPGLVKGHYYDNSAEASGGADDPWSTPNDTPAIYTPDMGDDEVEGSFYLDDGFSAEMHVGRALVIHDATGARIGCGLLELCD